MAKYVEFPQFKDADLSAGYFCGSCVFFRKEEDDCMIVMMMGESADGVNSERIAPYAMCGLWKPDTHVVKGGREK